MSWSNETVEVIVRSAVEIERAACKQLAIIERSRQFGNDALVACDNIVRKIGNRDVTKGTAFLTGSIESPDYIAEQEEWEKEKERLDSIQAATPPAQPERRKIWGHLPGKPFAIRRFTALPPLIAGAAYGTEMVERRVLPDRRAAVPPAPTDASHAASIRDKVASIIENDSETFNRAINGGVMIGSLTGIPISPAPTPEDSVTIDMLNRVSSTLLENVTKPMIELEWTDPSAPNGDCHYHHSIAETPFGRFLLAWKGWKDDPGYGFDETPWGEVEYHGWNTVEEAQEWAEEEMSRRIEACFSASKK